MNNRERLLAPFKGIKPDRPAWLADLSYWYSAMKQQNKLAKKYCGREGVKLFHEELGVCNYYSFGAMMFKAIFEGVELVIEEKDGVRIRTWKTNSGEISDKWEYIRQSYCWAHTEYAVKCISDLAVLREIFANLHYSENNDTYNATVNFLGDSGLPICPFARSPFPALLADWCGVMNTIYFMMDAPEEVIETLRVIEKSVIPSFEIALKSNVELFHFCDNLDSSASASYFDEFMKEYYTERLKQIHAAGKFAVVHLDGSVRGLLGKLAACGFDGVEAITPAPVGDIKIDEIRSVANNKDTVIWGGVPGAMFSEPWKRDDIVRHTEHLLQIFDGDTRFIVGSADQIPPDGNINFVKAVAKAIQENF